jgi:eukaryotic-like serine/threonine-protein kinase
VAIDPGVLAAAVVLCVLLVLAAIAVTVRQLGPGRDVEALAPPRAGLPQSLGAPLTPDDPDFPPAISFRQYSVVETARGGVGTVYRAIHPATGGLYAIKQLNRQFTNDQVVIEAFHRGAAMLMRLRHPNIVRVYYDWMERNEERHEHYVVMEYLPGETMHDRVRTEAPLPVDERFLEEVRGIGDAVSYLHGNQIVHRDLKPENFRLHGRRYKLLDFDTAIHRGQRGLLPQDGVPVGTPEYMSPEQARGAPDIDGRADVYSFGILLYELLTGNVPFSGAPSRVLIDQMETPPPPPRSLNDQIPPAVDAVILMALQKDRERRFQSIQALLTALESAIPETAAIGSTSDGKGV